MVSRELSRAGRSTLLMASKRPANPSFDVPKPPRCSTPSENVGKADSYSNETWRSLILKPEAYDPRWAEIDLARKSRDTHDAEL